MIASPLHRRSALYAGTVRHRRLRPRRNAFRYGVYHVLVDLDELPRLDRELRGFGHNRRAVTTFHDRDHLGAAPLPVRDKLAGWLERNGARLPDGPVLLLTNLRVLGYVFNPVSWFFCHDEDGHLRLIVAEVSNTFGETYCYLLDDLVEVGGGAVRASRAKMFHVSPFMAIADHRYDFTLQPPGDRLMVHMDVADAGGKLFDATLVERWRPLTGATLAWALVRYPLVTLRTIALIQWQALRLLVKRVPVFRKPVPPDNGLDVSARPEREAVP